MGFRNTFGGWKSLQPSVSQGAVGAFEPPERRLMTHEKRTLYHVAPTTNIIVLHSSMLEFRSGSCQASFAGTIEDFDHQAVRHPAHVFPAALLKLPGGFTIFSCHGAKTAP